jgi:hypothetical protein
MLTQRLAHWVSRFVVALTAHLRPAAPAQRDREMVLTGAAPALSARHAAASHLFASCWLADAQRMRPPRRPKDVSPPRGAVPESGADFPDHMERRSPTPSRSRLSGPGDKPNALPSGQQQPAVQPPALHPTPPASAADGTHALPETGDDLDESLRRRLRSLRFLVRHGVYSEGFSSDRVPEQYRASLGLSDDDE